jgi:hypothetical protein
MLEDPRLVIRETASKQLTKIEREREQLHRTFNVIEHPNKESDKEGS